MLLHIWEQNFIKKKKIPIHKLCAVGQYYVLFFIYSRDGKTFYGLMPDVHTKFLTVKKLCIPFFLLQYHLVEFITHSLLNIVYGLLI